MTGILLVDKPAGMTSHDVVDHVRKAAGIRRVGHTGTLDPNATGLLILCLGKATRLSEHLTGLDKAYEGTMRLGVVTDSYDSDGEVVEEHPVPELDIPAIQAVCDQFVGDIQQVPPMVSAVKVDGQPLYKRARKGEVVERQARPVTVSEFTVLGYTPPEATLRVRCTRGTYVRSLCHEVGERLGCGAILSELRRTEVGPHNVTDAAVLDALQNREDVFSRLIPMGEALDYPAVTVRGESRNVVLTGGTLAPRDLLKPCMQTEGWVQVKGENGHLLALGQIETSAAGALIHPKRVFD
ncbi:MAG: tRNA pseudouridine(55) synthase TruB [Candidatus Hydrogenedens sp.]|nr:tRNA pseudouridine(55) synthase TruB [Candidatus Hydrogenedens sp.]